MSVVPGLTEQSVNVPAHQEQQQHNNHEQPAEEEAETCTPATTSGSEIKKRAHGVKQFEKISSSTHIMRKVPPQLAVQERFVGSALDFRPGGPRTRPRRLHTTTRRTTQHTIKHTPHLEKHAHMVTFGFQFWASFLHVCMCLHFQAFYLICSALSTSGVSLPISVCNWSRVLDTSARPDKGISSETWEICVCMSPNSCLLSEKIHIHKHGYLFKKCMLFN